MLDFKSLRWFAISLMACTPLWCCCVMGSAMAASTDGSAVPSTASTDTPPTSQQTQSCGACPRSTADNPGDQPAGCECPTGLISGVPDTWQLAPPLMSMAWPLLALHHSPGSLLVESDPHPRHLLASLQPVPGHPAATLRTLRCLFLI